MRVEGEFDRKVTDGCGASDVLAYSVSADYVLVDGEYRPVNVWVDDHDGIMDEDHLNQSLYQLEDRHQLQLEGTRLCPDCDGAGRVRVCVDASYCMGYCDGELVRCELCRGDGAVEAES